MAKKKPNEINLGAAFGPAVIHVNGLTIKTDGKGGAHFSRNGVQLDITDDTITLFGGNIKVRGPGITEVVPVEEPANAITHSLDEKAIKPGDILGVDVPLPEALRHLENWFVYNVKKGENAEDVVQVFEPEDHLLYWGQFSNYIDSTLKPQGHWAARMMNEADAVSIFNNVTGVKASTRSPIELYDEGGVKHFWGEGLMDDNVPTEYAGLYRLDVAPSKSVVGSGYKAAYGLAVQDISLKALQP